MWRSQYCLDVSLPVEFTLKLKKNYLNYYHKLLAGGNMGHRDSSPRWKLKTHYTEHNSAPRWLYYVTAGPFIWCTRVNARVNPFRCDKHATLVKAQKGTFADYTLYFEQNITDVEEASLTDWFTFNQATFTGGKQGRDSTTTISPPKAEVECLPEATVECLYGFIISYWEEAILISDWLYIFFWYI